MPFLGSMLPQGRCWPTAFLNLGLGATLFLFPHPRLLNSSLGAQLFCPPSLLNLSLGAISAFDPHSEIKNVFQNPSKTYSAVPVPVILLVKHVQCIPSGVHTNPHTGALGGRDPAQWLHKRGLGRSWGGQWENGTWGGNLGDSGPSFGAKVPAQTGSSRAKSAGIPSRRRSHRILSKKKSAAQFYFWRTPIPFY